MSEGSPLCGKLRVFPLATVLTVVTGFRFIERPEGLFDLLNHMSRDNLCGFQLMRVRDECVPWLKRWYPKLAKAEGQDVVLNRVIQRLDAAKREAFDSPPFDIEEMFDSWLAESDLDQELQEEYIVGQIPQDDHEKISPIEELMNNCLGMTIIEPPPKNDDNGKV